MHYVKTAVELFSNLLIIAIIARMLLSWLPIKKGGAVPRFLAMFTEPVLGPTRRLVERSPLGGNKPSGLALDLSPFIAWIMITLAKEILLGALGLFK